eukprot:Awhi_evm1s5082
MLSAITLLGLNVLLTQVFSVPIENPCSSVICLMSMECVVENNVGVCKCPAGFWMSNNVCLDVDECTDPSKSNCDINALCINTIGSFQCECQGGYEGDGRTCREIESVDPCADSPCGIEATCEVVNDRPVCSCPSGFSGDPFTRCLDVNECEDPSKSNCDVNAVCINTNGSFHCDCQGGFEGDGHTCEETKSCRTCDFGYNDGCNDCKCDKEGNSQCTERKCIIHTTPFCTFECTSDSMCDGDQACISNERVDPCADSPCGTGATCEVINHRPVCSCPSGFSGNPFTRCLDIDECEDPSKSNCDENAVCFNTDGGFQCECQGGFEGDGHFCEETKSCRTCNFGYNDGCNDCRCDQEGNSQCTKRKCIIHTTPFCTFECTSDAMCDGDQACIYNECVDPCADSPCGIGATCEVINHRPVCSCLNGFSGDPLVECQDPNACSINSDCPKDKACSGGKCTDTCRLVRCPLNSVCAVENHEASCNCNDGFTLIDGVCRDATPAPETCVFTTLKTEAGDVGPCRLDGDHGTAGVEYELFGKLNLAECEEKCLEDDECVAFEAQLKYTRCEIWKKVPNGVKTFRTTYTCKRKECSSA